MGDGRLFFVLKPRGNGEDLGRIWRRGVFRLAGEGVFLVKRGRGVRYVQSCIISVQGGVKICGCCVAAGIAKGAWGGGQDARAPGGRVVAGLGAERRAECVGSGHGAWIGWVGRPESCQALLDVPGNCRAC